MKTTGKTLMEEFSHLCEAKVLFQRKTKKGNPLKSSSQIYNYLKPWYEDSGLLEQRECMTAVLCTNNFAPVAIIKIGEGEVRGTVADLQYLFRAAILTNTNKIFLAHNHPSGNTNPSDADIKLTNRAKEAAKFLDMQIVDHMIITADGYYSMADEGII